MNHVYITIAVSLITMLAVLPACDPKKEKAQPQQQAAPATTLLPQDKAAAPVASPQEKDEARAAAVKVLEQFSAGDFATIYKNSTPGFKQIGSESQFVEKFQQTRQKVGVLKNPKEVSFDTRPDKNHVLVYRLENDLYKTDLRLTFSRSKSGKMELAGLNQHDEVKK